MPQIEVTLPSGARGRVRGLKGREINLFANQASARQQKTSLQILANVWVETLEPGPLYNAEIDWEEAPMADRFTALFYARIATFGPEFEFKHKCRGCGRSYNWVEDLKQRPVKPLPAKSIERFLGGNRFVTSVEDPEGASHKVVFQLMTPKLEKKVSQAQNANPKERATASLAQRIVEIEGLEDGKSPIKRFLEDLDALPFYDLLRDMDDVDGGVETEIEIECPHCGHEEELELPLEQGEFWTLKSKRR